MFAMTPKTRVLSWFAERRQVAPRLLRRPLRLFSRVMSGHLHTPRYFGSVATAVFFAITGVYGTVAGGHVPSIIKSVTASSGFAIEEILIAGHGETSEIDVLGELGLDGGTSLIGFSSHEARDRIAQLPWVRFASVRKIYPDTLEINIVEREAFAILQQGDRLSLIDRDGNHIIGFTDGKYAGLPLVVGYGAAEKAYDFVSRVAQVPEIAGRVKSYIRVADRRWDLRFENGMTVRLPEHDADLSLVRLLELDGEHGLLSRDLSAVDMRIADRLVLQLTPEAATSRKAAVEKRINSAAGDKRI